MHVFLNKEPKTEKKGRSPFSVYISYYIYYNYTSYYYAYATGNGPNFYFYFKPTITHAVHETIGRQ